MFTATLTTKGQITIPVDVHCALNVEAGDRVEFVQIEPGRFEVIATTRAVSELTGRFGKPTRVVTIEGMSAASAAQVRERDDRPRHGCRGSLHHAERSEAVGQSQAAL